jgi:hypothetical protein
MKPLAPSQQPGIKLQQPGDDDDRLNYDEMVPYTEEAFTKALQQGKVTTFYVTESLEEVVEYVNREKLSFRRYFTKSAAVPSSMHVYMNKSQTNRIEEAAAGDCKKPKTKDAVKVKVLPKDHKKLKLLSDAFHELTGYKLEYKGEGMASLMDRMIQQLLVTKRKEASQADKKVVCERQGDRCAACSVKLDNRAHLDHKKPLHEGGSNELDNLQYLCRECHESKTQMEELARGSRYHPLLSFMSPKMYETYCKMPKPMELSGRWADPRWVDPKYEQVKCLDVKGCRSNALLEYQYGLPTFSPLDDWEEYLAEDGCPNRPLDSYDFLYVNIPERQGHCRCPFSLHGRSLVLLGGCFVHGQARHR